MAIQTTARPITNTAECTCPAYGIGPDWVEVPGSKSGLLHLKACPLLVELAEIEAEREMEARIDQFRRQEAETAMGWTLC